MGRPCGDGVGPSGAAGRRRTSARRENREDAMTTVEATEQRDRLEEHRDRLDELRGYL
jgi:hypothetical protein